MNEATLGKRAKKIGFETGHSFSLTDKAKLKLVASGCLHPCDMSAFSTNQPPITRKLPN